MRGLSHSGRRLTVLEHMLVIAPRHLICKGMKALHTSPEHSELSLLRVLAALLDRLDDSEVRVDGAQYLGVVTRLEQALRDAKPSDALRELLATQPAASELYENAHYEVAGLCCSPLETSVAAEQSARAVIQRAMQTPRESSANGQS